MMTRDRLIVLLAAAPGVLGFSAVLLAGGNLLLAAAAGGVLSLLAAGISLSPPVQRARMRLLRRKYPDEI